MARFKYEGRDRTGKKAGKLSANSKREAVLKLSEQGIRMINIEEIPETFLTKEIAIGNPVKLQDFVIYLRQFSTLLRAGVTIVDATNILSKQTSSKALRNALEQIEEDLKSGQALSDSAAKHNRIFSSMFVNMIKAGEASGSMEETLDRLAIQYEKQHRTKQKIQSALAYPIAVAIVAIVVVIFLLVSVVPTFVSMFEGFGAQLPAITLFVLNSSIFMQEYWYVVILFFVAIFVGFYALRKNKQTRYYLDVITLKMPIFGSMIQKAVLARMTRTLSSLFSSAVPILQSLMIVEKIVENEVISEVLAKSRASLENGRSLTEPMKQHWAFPPLVTQMIAIGEETGSLDEMLGKVADFYEEEVENSTDRLKSLIEPLMIVLLAGIVGTIVIAIIVPMFDIFNHVQM
ncbi:type II secretion system F family protein [Metabacillus halosaccharovorans]|uniref:type II secretion system F family protein n=1 Tax=Metabacillus halosaccharovorans TaxID=930124 RepID=UPI00203F566F|nr:type II secretion system F family protein [Metabacillus halosaccharovorans]MCM3441959.1 type II secretion system F family protein [Metabacillus halosaccharovorans]